MVAPISRFAHGEARTLLGPSGGQECNKKQSRGVLGFNGSHACLTSTADFSTAERAQWLRRMVSWRNAHSREPLHSSQVREKDG